MQACAHTLIRDIARAEVLYHRVKAAKECSVKQLGGLLRLR
jgi:hypothetical protein